MSERKEYRQIGSTIYRVFGKLVEVRETDDYLILVNDEGDTRSMAKRFYVTWKQRKERAEELIDRNVLTRFGGSGMPSAYSSSSYFNEVIFDAGNEHGGLLDAPPDAGPQAQDLIAMLRISNQLQDYHRTKRTSSLELGLEASKEQLENLQEHVARLEEERAQLTPDQRAELTQAIRDVAKAWPDWLDNNKQAFNIPKTGSSGKLYHVHKTFMLRYGIDVTKRSRLNVTLLRRSRDNYVHCTLDDYDEQPCIIALKRIRGGQWVIPSVDAIDTNYYRFEKRVLPENGKDANKPIAWFEDKHKEIFKRLEQATFKE